MPKTSQPVQSFSGIDTLMPPVKKREIFGWAMFDFANSSYTTVVITVVYSVFFVEHIVPNDSAWRDSYWSIAMILSTLLALLLSPLIGAICDHTGYKKRYLLASTLVCSVFTMSLWSVSPGNVWWAIFLITFSAAGFLLSESLCGSFLPELANKSNMGLISGLGWGIGYFGGLASLIMIQLLVTADAKTNTLIFIQENQMAMVATGLFFLLAAIPTFVLVKERAKPQQGFERAPLLQLWKEGARSWLEMGKIAKQHPILFRFFIAFMIYMAGMDAVIKFVGIYATSELGFQLEELTIMFLILQFSAAFGAFGFGILEKWIGPRNTILVSVALWIVGALSTILLSFISELLGITPKTTFWGVALVTGMAIGSTQSSSRTMVGLLAPQGNSAQLFGFWGMFARLATILGMSYGFVSDFLGSRQTALFLLIFFFVLGAALLLRIPRRVSPE